MTVGSWCNTCGERGGEGATFCRRCGGRLEVLVAGDPRLVVPDEVVDALATAEDQRRLLRDLWWLGAGPVAVSIALTVWSRIGGVSALGDVVGVGAVAGLALVGAVMSWPLVRRGLRWPRLRGWGLTLLVALVAVPALSGLFTLLERLGFAFFDGYLDPYERDGWPIWAGYVATAVVTPLAEELLFRGLLQPKLERIVTPTEALIVQAALFSAVHLSLVILVTHFLMGFAFGWLRRTTQSLLPGVLLHGAWNAWVLWSS